MSAVYKNGVMGPETFARQLCLIVLLVCRVVLVALFLAGGFGRHTSDRVLALDDGRRAFFEEGPETPRPVCGERVCECSLYKVSEGPRNFCTATVFDFVVVSLSAPSCLATNFCPDTLSA